MTDIANPKLLYAKALLFLLGGLMASGLLLAELPTLRVALLLAVAVWCFARFYYFAFYVIEHYVDPGYRFAGLWDFARYVCRRTDPAEERGENRPPPEACGWRPGSGEAAGLPSDQNCQIRSVANRNWSSDVKSS